MFKIIALSTLLIAALSINVIDDVTIMPQWPEYTFKTYSGYINVGSTEEPREIHYVFIESQSATPEEDPVVLWLNGGPGCSSLLGLLQEVGPFVIDNGETEFKANAWSWNKKANLLFLESPAGVGFSKPPAQGYVYNDVNTGADNYQAIRIWFDTFTQFKGRPFWISGESYAGMYIPYTAKALVIAEEQVPEEDRINLKGLLIGNGVLVADDKFRELTATIFMGRRNFYDPITQVTLYHSCFLNPESVSCKYARRSQANSQADVNPYSVYDNCWADSTKPEFKVTSKSRFPYTSWLKFNEEEEDSAPCIDFGPTQNYFNDDAVKAALHIDNTIKWSACNDLINETYEMNKAGSYLILPELAAKGVKILLYSGDQDLAVSMVETLNSIKKITPKVQEVKKWTPYANSNVDDPVAKGQLAGWITEYDILTYWVIRGAGHMVPQDQRQNGWFMFDEFINRE